MKKIFIISLIIVVFVSALAVTKDQIIKNIVAYGASKVIGARVDIGGFSMGIFKQSVQIRDLKVFNPEGFPSDILLDMPMIRADYDLKAILRKELHIRFLEINLKELNIVRDEKGILNVDSLKIARDKEKKAEQLPMRIDTLNLTVGKVYYRDFSQAGGKLPAAFDVGITGKTYKNITSARQLIVLILTESMKQTTIKNAAIYGVSSLLGIGFLPAGAAVAGMSFLGGGTVKAEFNAGFDKAYGTVLDVMSKIGSGIKEDKDKGVIKAKVNGNDVTIMIVEKTSNTAEISVLAKKFILPQPETANDILGKISERLK
jgi:hypothetical protein